MSELPDLTAPSPADGPTTPGRPAVGRPGGPADRPTDRLGPAPQIAPRPARRSRSGGGWIGVVLAAVVLVVLLVAVLGNLAPVPVSFLGQQVTLPLGLWLLIAAVAGVLLVAIPLLGRMLRRPQPGRSRR